MSEDGGGGSRSMRWTERMRVLGTGGVETALTGAVVACANYFANWRMSPTELAGSLAGWSGVMLASAFLRSARGSRVALALEALAAGLYWTVVGRFGLEHAMPVGVVVYLSVALVGLLTVWRGLACAVAARSGADALAEQVRWLTIVTAALWVLSPMITDNLVSGTDARWYAYMLHDFIEQWRTAGPPVFLGQGEFAWNGAVHPFRSAPVFLHVGGVWDWLTLGALPATSLQHLTAIAAAVVGGLTVYGAANALIVGRRWAALAVGVLYVWAPALLTALYSADAYMTYTAGAALALLFFGNARMLQMGRGQVALAAGLALAWMSHPPTAMHATLATGLLQLGALAFGRGDRESWRRAAWAGALFVALSLYYFVGMSELPPGSRGSLLDDVAQLAGLALGWFALAQTFVMRRSWFWAGLLVPAATLLAKTSLPWLVWLALTAALLAGLVGILRRWTRFEPADYGALVLLFAVFASATIGDLLLRARWIPASHYLQESAVWRSAWEGDYFRPVDLQPFGNGWYQPGWGLWLGWAAVGWAACRARAWQAQLCCAAIALMSVNVLPWPRLAVFITEFFPADLRNLAGAGMVLRSMPVFSALLLCGLLLSLAELGRASRAWQRGLTVVLVACALWAGWQARTVVAHGFRAVQSTKHTEQAWRRENAPFDRFVYDLLPIPSYFSHGKFDPAFELRLRSDTQRVLHGPSDLVRTMEAIEHKTVRLVTAPFGAEKQWLLLQPGFTVLPGEKLILRFEFDPQRHYDGHLILAGSHSYREYALPESGLAEAFGTQPGNARHLVIWNTQDQPENYEFQFLRGPGNDLAGDGGFFADLTISRYDVSRAPVELVAFDPLRIRTRFEQAGWLETLRVALPGYAVSVDGRTANANEVGISKNGLLQVRVSPGPHEVEVRFVGSTKLRAAGWASLVAWLGVIGYGLHRWRLAAEARPKER